MALHKLISLALTALCLTACPQARPDTTAAPTTSGAPVHPDTSTATGQESSTSAADTTTGPAAPSQGPTVCAPTQEFCWAFEAWCPHYYDKQTCQGVPSCEGRSSVCELCTEVRAICEETRGEGDALCLTGEQKCLASTLLPGCECQPAVFPCEVEQGACPEGYLLDDGRCRPPCDPSSAGCGTPEYAGCVEGYCLPRDPVLCP